MLELIHYLEQIDTKKQAIHDADARDGYPHALWGGHGHRRLVNR